MGRVPSIRRRPGLFPVFVRFCPARRATSRDGHTCAMTNDEIPNVRMKSEIPNDEKVAGDTAATGAGPVATCGAGCCSFRASGFDIDSGLGISSFVIFAAVHFHSHQSRGSRERIAPRAGIDPLLGGVPRRMPGRGGFSCARPRVFASAGSSVPVSCTPYHHERELEHARTSSRLQPTAFDRPSV